MSQQPAPEATPARVLVVDDNADNRDLMQRRLSRRGYHVHAVDEGVEALRELSSRGYDAVLLDIEMPGMSGLEVLRRVRARFTKAELPVLMATARTEGRDMVEAFQLGANDYVTKPLDYDVVVARLETHLSLREEVRAASGPPVVLASSEDLAPGTMIDGRYRVDTLLGGGGFAVVYAGEQVASGLPVAIKLLRSQRLVGKESERELARFELEMRVIARVQHPAIVRLIDSGTLVARPVTGTDQSGERDAVMVTTKLSGAARQGERSVTPSAPPSGSRPQRTVPYIVMERLSGRNLAEVLAAGGPLPLERAVDYLLPIIDGLGVLHEKEILHRDAKPSNIVLAEDGGRDLQPKILDFGIAKVTAVDQPAITQSASVLGTPLYMSPEQACGLPLDGRSDQYTLAAVLFECVTGRPPCEGESSVEVLKRIAAGVEVVEALGTSDLGVEIKGVLGRALSRDPGDRFPHMAAFGQALLPFASEKGAATYQRLRTTAPTDDV